MTIAGWVLVIFGWILVLGIAAVIIAFNADRVWAIVLTIIVAIALCVGIYSAGQWYYTSTASGVRELTDERSNLSNGIERTIIVYTADGKIIAKYEGKIDIEANEDYVKFDWEGKRYIYYNCFVETIADLSR